MINIIWIYIRFFIRKKNNIFFNNYISHYLIYLPLNKNAFKFTLVQNIISQ